MDSFMDSFGAFAILLLLLLVVLVVLWIFLPFAIFGTKERLDTGNSLAKKTNSLLLEVEKLLQEQTELLRQIERQMPIDYDRYEADSDVKGTHPVAAFVASDDRRVGAVDEDSGLTEWEYKGEKITKRGYDYYIGNETRSCPSLQFAKAVIDDRQS